MHYPSVGLIVPTLNASSHLVDLLPRLQQQTVTPDIFFVVDSSSEDGTTELARAAGALVHVIPREDFDHGGTRQYAIDGLVDTDIVVFMTQDAVPADIHTFERLLTSFEDESVAAAYGRQLPKLHANPIEAHARLFNYPPTSQVRSKADASRLGLKTIFISNSFSAFRRRCLIEVGGFQKKLIFGEDTVAAAKLLLAGYKIAYCADACVLHSHAYSTTQEFRRYFDIGVLHSQEQWLRTAFGMAEGEGLRYLKSELSYLAKESPSLIPSAMVRTFLKYTGYRLGCLEKWLPAGLKAWLSMHRHYWYPAARSR